MVCVIKYSQMGNWGLSFPSSNDCVAAKVHWLPFFALRSASWGSSWQNVHSEVLLLLGNHLEASIVSFPCLFCWHVRHGCSRPLSYCLLSAILILWFGPLWTINLEKQSQHSYNSLGSHAGCDKAFCNGRHVNHLCCIYALFFSWPSVDCLHQFQYTGSKPQGNWWTFSWAPLWFGKWFQLSFNDIVGMICISGTIDCPQNSATCWNWCWPEFNDLFPNVHVIIPCHLIK